MHLAKTTGMALGGYGKQFRLLPRLDLHVGSLPIPGKQFSDLFAGMIWKPGEHVGEPGLRIDVVHLAGFDQRIDSGGAMAAGVRTGEGPIASSDRHTPQRSFRGVVRKTDAAVVEEAGERCPAVEEVVDRFGGIVLGGDSARCSRIQISSATTSGLDCSWRTASRCPAFCR